MKIFIFSLLLYLMVMQTAFCATPSTLDNKRLEQQVAAAMGDAKKGDFKQLEAFESHREDVLPFLQKYVSYPNKNVQYMLIQLASNYTSDVSQELIIQEIASSFPKVSKEAIFRIFYEPTKLNHKNQQLLKTNLLDYIQSRYDSPETILLLSRYHGDPEVISALQEQRIKHPTAIVWLRNAPAIDLYTFYDIALAHLGDKEAVVRLKDVISDAKVDNLVAIFGAQTLDTLEYVDNSSILSQLVECIHDKRETSIDIRVFSQAVPFSYGIRSVAFERPHYQYLRVCDLALMTLIQKANIRITGAPKLWDTNYTDDELNTGYTALKTYFAK